MLRIISGFLLLIISQITFAVVTTSTETISATSSSTPMYAVGSFSGTDKEDVVTRFCAGYGKPYHIWDAQNTAFWCYQYPDQSGKIGAYGLTLVGSQTVYSCPSGYSLSNADGTLNSSGTYCTGSTTTDSCTELAGTTYKLWVPAAAVPATVCFQTCAASNLEPVYASAPDSLGYYSYDYSLTGATCVASDEIGLYVDDATAAAGNAAQAEKDRQAAVEAAVESAKAGCGGAGTYTTGTFNGDTIVSCISSPTQTTVNNTAQSTTTTANADGSTTTTTTTTTTNNTTINNNNSSTTIGSNGSSSTTAGTTGGSGSSTTKTESVTTNPDGSTTTDITETTSGSGNTAGIFEEPGEGTDYMKDIFSAEAVEDLKQSQESVKEQITALQSSIKNLFSFGAIAATGTMEANTQNIMGASVDMSGKSIIDLFTQGNIGSAFWVLAILIGITVVLTKRN